MKNFSYALALFASCSFLNSFAMAADLSDLRGKRYGEVLLGKGGILAPKEFDVYNTIGLNDCPEELWSKLDSKKIAVENGVKVVKLNGPRFWVIDGITNSTLVSTSKKSFGGIEMRHAGTLKLTLKDELNRRKPYSVHSVERNTTWIFKAGLPVYQLVTADQSVYFMQSFSVQKEVQSMESLAKLGSRLTLPAGWKFRTLTLKKDFALKAENGVAYVLQDDFDNTYQKSLANPEDAP